MVRAIDFYRTESGRCPVEDFLDSLQPKEAQKVVWVLRLVQELDRVPSQYFKKLDRNRRNMGVQGSQRIQHLSFVCLFL